MNTTPAITALPYKVAPEGSPDKFMLTADTTFYWDNPPKWVWALVKCPVTFLDGVIWRYYGDGIGRRIALMIRAGFFFAVSVAPNDPAAVPGSCPHDWIYQHVAALAKAWGVSILRVLVFADHWFLAVMRYTRFKYAREYFMGVSVFGFAFNRIGALFSKHSPDADASGSSTTTKKETPHA